MPRARSRAVSGRRPTTWLGFADTDFVAVAANSTSIVTAIGEATWASFPEPTIVRIRGMLDVMVNPVGANNDDVRWGAGLGMISAQAFAAGASAVHAPLSNSDWGGWMWWATGVMRQRSTYSEFSAPQAGVSVVIDSKAMRKVENDSLLVCVVETLNGAGSAGVLISAAARVLVKR